MQIQFLKNGKMAAAQKRNFFLPQTSVSGVAVATEDHKRNFHAIPFQGKQYIWMIQYAF